MSEIPAEVQVQIEAQKAQCIFCKIVRGEIESSKIYEDEYMIGVLDINPAVKGHALFLPKEHYPIMPLVPPEMFKHLFSKIPQIAKAMQESLLMTGFDVFIANGGAAGQQSPHFLIHVLPREEGDGVDYGLGQNRDVDAEKREQVNRLFSQNLPIMMQNHFTRNPADWHKGEGKLVAGEVYYQDEKSYALPAEPLQSLAHTIVRSKISGANISDLGGESSAHLFYVASFAATAAFEGLKAHGTNIIMRSGAAHDRKDALLQIDVLDRYSEDGLEVHWTPMQIQPDLGALQSQLSDALFPVVHTAPGDDTATSETNPGSPREETDHKGVEPEVLPESDDPLDEVRRAIAELHKEKR